MDMVPSEAPAIESIIADRDLLDRLFARLRELDHDADTIIAMWMDDGNVSDRAIAKALGRPQRTFADQMKKYRTELRRMTSSSRRSCQRQISCWPPRIRSSRMAGR